MNKSAAHGFTLIELMVSIAVLAVLLGVAIPSFRSVIASSRVPASTNDFLVALTYSRSEAMKRGTPVTICPANAALTACVNSTSWSSGWIAFSDEGATIGAYDAGETVLQKWPALDGVANTADASNLNPFVRYMPAGTPYSAAASRFNIAQTGTSDYPRCVSVSLSGQITLKKLTKGCTCAAPC